MSEMTDTTTPQDRQRSEHEQPPPVRENRAPTEPELRARSSFIRAWVSIALVPVFFLAAFAVATGIYALSGYDPSAGATPPFWVNLFVGLVSAAILLTVCAAGVLYGLRAAKEGLRAGLVPAVIAALLGIGSVVLVVLGSG